MYICAAKVKQLLGCRYTRCPGPCPCVPLAECGDFFQRANALKTKIAGALANMALMLASCLAGLLLCELGLRLFHPKYEHLAEAAFTYGPNLVPVRPPNHRGIAKHPDSGVRHAFFHNNHGLRQHRNFSAADLESSVNIGFFGDSFLENVGMEAQFSFTEPLDYLLNFAGGTEVNVLNFGLSGYGTSQSLLRYETWDFREALDHVFYVYYRNDPRDNLVLGPFHLDDAGRLVRGGLRPSRFSLLSKLHLSYLVMDAAGRMASDEARDRQSALALFRQILRRWKTVAENNGASFQFVRLPMEVYPTCGSDLTCGADLGVDAIVEAEGIKALNLRDCFAERDPAHLRTPWQSSPYRFERSGRWNEVGNRLAAVCLHRFLESRLGLPRLTEEQVDQALRLYYSAFEASASAGGGGARGDAPRVKSGGGGAQGDAIRRKYGALDGGLRPSWTPSPDKLVIRSHFDVHLHEGWLAYFKEGCKSADFDANFFLHVFPVDARNLPSLPPHRQEPGFENWDFRRGAIEEKCLIRTKLPDYAIERIRTGQFVKDGAGRRQNLWEGEHVFAEG